MMLLEDLSEVCLHFRMMPELQIFLRTETIIDGLVQKSIGSAYNMERLSVASTVTNGQNVVTDE